MLCRDRRAQVVGIGADGLEGQPRRAVLEIEGGQQQVLGPGELLAGRERIGLGGVQQRGERLDVADGVRELHGADPFGGRW